MQVRIASSQVVPVSRSNVSSSEISAAESMGKAKPSALATLRQLLESFSKFFGGGGSGSRSTGEAQITNTDTFGRPPAYARLPVGESATIHPETKPGKTQNEVSQGIQADNLEAMKAKDAGSLAADFVRNNKKITLTLPNGTQITGKDPKEMLSEMIKNDSGLTDTMRYELLSALSKCTPGTDTNQMITEFSPLVGKLPDESQTLSLLKMSNQSMEAPVSIHMSTDLQNHFNGIPLPNLAQKGIALTMSKDSVGVQISEDYEFRRDQTSPKPDFTVSTALNLKFDTALNSDLRFSSATLGQMAGVSRSDREAIGSRLESFGAKIQNSDRTMQSDAHAIIGRQLDTYKTALETLQKKYPDGPKSDMIQKELAKVDAQIQAHQETPHQFDDASTKDINKATKQPQKDLEKLMGKLHPHAGRTHNVAKSIAFKGLALVTAGVAYGVLKLVQSGVGDTHKLAKAEWSNASQLNVNGKEWKEKSSTIAGGLTSRITPANASAAGAVRSEVMIERGPEGLSCQSNQNCSDKAANNQMTELKRADGKVVFSGVRHAITATKKGDPEKTFIQGRKVKAFIADLKTKLPDDRKTALTSLGISEDSAKKLLKTLDKGDGIFSSGTKKAEAKLTQLIANRTKAVDIARSALVQKLSEMAERGDDPSKMTSIELNLTSVSLVTPDGFRAEKNMLAQQREAMAMLETLTPDEKKELLSDLVNQDGTPLFDPVKLPKLTISTATFNFGVNEGERMGRHNQAEQNQEAMAVLSKRMNAKLDSMSDGAEKIALKALKDKLTEEFTAFNQLHEGSLPGDPTVRAFGQKNQDHPYLLPTLVMAANQLCDGSLAFNCMSGKDRTGMADVFGKRFMADLYEAMDSGVEENIKGAITSFTKLSDAFKTLESAGLINKDTKFSELDDSGFTDTQKEALTFIKDTQAKNYEMMMNSGNREVQEENTSGWGYKLTGNSLIGRNTERFFQMAFGVSQKDQSVITGFSKNFGA